MCRYLIALVTLLVLGLPAKVCWSEEYRMVKEDSIFAVVTHKGGVASAMAHNHFIYPTAYEASLSMEGDELISLRFRLEFPVANLRIDHPDVQSRWFPKLKDAGVLKQPFSKVSDKDRKSIAATMLAAEQLDADTFPKISVELREVRAQETEVNGKTFTHRIRIAMTTHGQTVERDVPATLSIQDDVLQAEAVGEFTFEEFGIKPYSAFWGSVKNKNVFHIYVNLKARKVAQARFLPPPPSQDLKYPG